MQKKRFVLAVTISLAIVVLASSIGSPKADNSGLTPKEELGKFLFFDQISSPDSMSCADCHEPSVGFTGPVPWINKHGAVYRGAVLERFGNRRPPSAAYATPSPIFHYDASEGLFVGGNFWDGRATGEKLGNPAADQALGPFLNPVEQNNPSSQAVLEQVADSDYASLWEIVWGEPISHATPEDIEENYDRIGLAIAAYEASSEVNQFSSKFDLWVAGEAELTAQEAWGLELFNGEDKGKCALCHISGWDGDGFDPGDFDPEALFTDFTFDNVGTPKNPENPFYDMDEVFLDNGDPINPLGDAWIDPGLGGFLESHDNAEWQAMAAENMGKHKVPTLRNVDKRPRDDLPKAYIHNGVFKSLKEVVHFYNTRDVGAWPPPEVSDNVNTEELGNLGLSDAEEDAIVAFMETLTDGYVPSPAEDFSNVFFMSLEPGLNMISLPLEPIIAYTARSLAEQTGATMVIRYDTTLGKFVGFTPAASGDGFDISGGEGYIINVPAGGTAAFTGAAWVNEPSVELAPPVTRNDAWAFVVSGSVLDGDLMSVSNAGYTAIVKNLRTSEISTESVDPSGYFTVAWADLNRKAVIGAGDRIEVAVLDSSGSIVSGPFVHEVTLDAIRNAVVDVHLNLGAIIPAKSVLLQNYPNPFNPETWLPYHLSDANPVMVKIYSSSGQLIRTLDLGHKDAGIYASRPEAAYWDGKNEAGEQVSSGVYFYNIQAGDFTATRKMVVAK